jgi:phosphoesterase RecJ-like protein
MTSSVTADVKAVVEALRAHDRFLLVTHENPDGDAVGSILAAHLALTSLGKDVVLFLPGDTSPPSEYGFLGLDGLRRSLPEDATTRVLVALDCANASRMGQAETVLGSGPVSIDIDHHHDNSRFGDINLVVPDASSTAEILRDVIAELGVELTPELAEALYVALVTDTGRFQYTNTTPKALRLAAELVEAGVDVARVFHAVYEAVPFAKLAIVARALERARLLENGRLIVSHLLRSDFVELGAGEELAEGVIDSLRAVEGTEMAATVREPPVPARAPRRVSMRAKVAELDVSAIARLRGGGGHRQAAGFSSSEPVEEIVEFIRRQFAEARASARP